MCSLEAVQRQALSSLHTALWTRWAECQSCSSLHGMCIPTCPATVESLYYQKQLSLFIPAWQHAESVYEVSREGNLWVLTAMRACLQHS